MTKEPAPFEKAAQAIKSDFLSHYRNAQGLVCFPDVFMALGSLAGFGCQMSIREGFIKTGAISEDKAFVVVKMKDGETYFFGDFLNIPLLGGEKNQISVWGLVAGAAQQAGAKDLPDVREMVAYNARVLGTEAFGVPRVPQEYRSKVLPRDVLRKSWFAMQKLLTEYEVDPRFWGWTFALAGRYAILESKDSFAPEMAVKIMMESALPMSKVNPATLAPAP